MNIENIKALAEILSKNGLTKLEISEGGLHICLEKTAEKVVENRAVTAAEKTVCDVPSEEEEKTIDFNNITEVKSPLVGVFYAASSPDADPYVTIGSKVKKGDVLCIIEAMKVMNEITAECDGEVVDICLKNGDIAEFGQVLFKIF